MKKVIIIIVIIVLGIAIASATGIYEFGFMSDKDEENVEMDYEFDRFTGIYEAYNTACFADGICSATISGNEVVTIIGFSQDASGAFENPDIPFGTEVEVYAQKIGPNSYTLYGSEEFYIREK